MEEEKIKPVFKVAPLFNAEYLRNGTRYGHRDLYALLNGTI